jgi:hypothetical protein
MKIFAQCGFGDDMSDVRKGETVAILLFASAFGDVSKPITIEPNDCYVHYGEIDVIDHSLFISGLAIAASNILLDFLEIRFSFPPGLIIFDNLLNR